MPALSNRGKRPLHPQARPVRAEDVGGTRFSCHQAMEKFMTINPEIFWSVLAALFAYGLSNHVIGVVLGRITGQPRVATNHLSGGRAGGKAAS